MTSGRRVPLPDTRRRLRPTEQEQVVRRARELRAQPEAERALDVVSAWVNGHVSVGTPGARSLWVREQVAAGAGSLSLPTVEDSPGVTVEQVRQVDRQVPPEVEEAVLDLGILGMTVGEVFPIEARGAAADVWTSLVLEMLATPDAG